MVAKKKKNSMSRLTPGKVIKLEDFLTPGEIVQSTKLYEKCRKEQRTFAKQCADYIIQPRIKEMNEKLGSKHDPLYLAYCVEFCLLHANRAGAVQ